MELSFLIESSGDVTRKFRAVQDELNNIGSYLKEKDYGEQLKFLNILLHCMHAKFDATFPAQRPKFYNKNSNAMYRGERIEKLAGTFEYELRLDFEAYLVLEDIRERLANDIIESLQIITAFKKIKLLVERNLESDIKTAFQKERWID